MIVAATRLDHVSEEGIRQLVDAFYVKVRLDPELAPIFARAISGDWQPHLTKMYAFWSSVMLTTGRYKGNPVVKHMVIPGMKPQLFERWLALFEATCSELFDDATRDAFRIKVERIAESVKLALFYRPDCPWPPEPTHHDFRRHRQLHQMQIYGLRRGVSGRLFLRGRKHARDPSGRVHRLRRVRTGVSGRRDLGGH
jgi:hemoglobin